MEEDIILFLKEWVVTPAAFMIMVILGIMIFYCVVYIGVIIYRKIESLFIHVTNDVKDYYERKL